MTPEQWLRVAVRWLPEERAEWGAAMMGELEEVEPAERWGFALGCTRVALFPPSGGGGVGMVKGILFLLGLVVLAAFVLWRPEAGGTWMARAIGFFAMFEFATTILCVDVLVLGALAWREMKRRQGQAFVARWPAAVREGGRLAMEAYYGLLNPVFYLTIVSAGPQMAQLQREWVLGGWIEPMHASAAGLIAVVWGWRLCGSEFRQDWGAARAGLRVVLWASLGCLALFAFKDLRMAATCRPSTWSATRSPRSSTITATSSSPAAPTTVPPSPSRPATPTATWRQPHGIPTAPAAISSAARSS
jgi:hypothetical protein